MKMLRAGGLLDVLTPLSDCRQDSVEKMERRISEVSYMSWMDFYSEIFCCGFLCARLISVFFSLFSGYHAEGYHARTDAFKLTGYHAPYKLLGTGGLSHLRVVFSYFSFHRPIRQCFHNHNTTFPPSLAHTVRTHSTTRVRFRIGYQ